jgi:hypothetical protein
MESLFMNVVGDLRAALLQKENEVAVLKRALDALSDDDVQEGLRLLSRTVTSIEYDGLGVTAAAKRFLREAGEPQDTRSIADALLNRGLKTRSRNFLATVYSTLRNDQAFRRTKNLWTLLEEK